MLNLNVCKREGGNEGQDTRYWWYCWDLYAVGVFCIFFSADIMIGKSWCNDIEAMAKLNILTQQVLTIGTFFCKKKGRGCAFESWKFPLSAHAEVPVQLWAFPQMLRHVTETQLIPRVRRPPASFWFASSLNFLSNISLRSTWSGERVEDISTHHHPDYVLWGHSCP